jgi:hypothetical protein
MGGSPCLRRGDTTQGLVRARIEGFSCPSRYSALFKLEHVPPAFIADGLALLQVRYPEIPVVFADSRKFAEEWTYRLLAAALSDAKSGDSVAD